MFLPGIFVLVKIYNKKAKSEPTSRPQPNSKEKTAKTKHFGVSVVFIGRQARCLPAKPVFGEGKTMEREEFAIFLKHLKEASDRKQDIDAIVKEHEHRNVYIYNDGCFKKIFASEKNIALTTDLINACLNLIGADRIANPRLVNPYIPGELGYKSNEPDLVLFNDRENGPRDRISLDVQHDGSKIFNDRLVLYVARHTSNMVPSGENAKLDNLNLISFQLFDAYPWKISKNYRHTVQLRNQEQQLFFGPHFQGIAKRSAFM